MQLKKSIIRTGADVEAGKPVIFTSPSCLLPFIEHSEAILRKDEREKIQKSLQEACGFFVDHARGHAVRNFFKPIDLKVAIQIPCHLKIIEADKKLVTFVKALSLADTIELKTECCGFGGSRGFEKKWAHHADKIGEALADEIRDFRPHVIVSSCVTCRFQIRKLLGEKSVVSEADDLNSFIRKDGKSSDKIPVVHPLVLAHELLI